MALSLSSPPLETTISSRLSVRNLNLPKSLNFKRFGRLKWLSTSAPAIPVPPSLTSLHKADSTCTISRHHVTATTSPLHGYDPIPAPAPMALSAAVSIVPFPSSDDDCDELATVVSDPRLSARNKPYRSHSTYNQRRATRQANEISAPGHDPNTTTPTKQKHRPIRRTKRFIQHSLLSPAATEYAPIYTSQRVRSGSFSVHAPSTMSAGSSFLVLLRRSIAAKLGEIWLELEDQMEVDNVEHRKWRDSDLLLQDMMLVNRIGKQLSQAGYSHTLGLEILQRNGESSLLSIFPDDDAENSQGPVARPGDMDIILLRRSPQAPSRCWSPSQLVASLTLRHRDRLAARPSRKCQPRHCSPLSNCSDQWT